MEVGAEEASVFAAQSRVVPPPVASWDPQPSRVERSDKMYLSKMQTIFDKDAKCILQNCKRYFFQISK